MPKINKPYKCMYCGECYSTLSHVSICPCDKFSIPPSENTSNKSELVGVTASVGEALSVPVDWSFIDDEEENTFNLLVSSKGYVTCDLMYHNGDFVLSNSRILPSLSSAITKERSCIYYNLNDGNSSVCYDPNENLIGLPDFDMFYILLILMICLFLNL